MTAVDFGSKCEHCPHDLEKHVFERQSKARTSSAVAEMAFVCSECDCRQVVKL